MTGSNDGLFALLVLINIWVIFMAMRYIVTGGQIIQKNTPPPSAPKEPTQLFFFSTKKTQKVCADHLQAHPLAKKHIAIVVEKSECRYCKKST